MVYLGPVCPGGGPMGLQVKSGVLWEEVASLLTKGAVETTWWRMSSPHRTNGDFIPITCWLPSVLVGSGGLICPILHLSGLNIFSGLCDIIIII